MLLEDPLVADDVLGIVDMLVGVGETLVSVDDPLDAVPELSGIDDILVAVDAAVVDGIKEVELIDEELGAEAVDDDVRRTDRLEVCDDKDEDVVWVLKLDEVEMPDEVKVFDGLSVVRLELSLLWDVFCVVDEKLRELLLLGLVYRNVDDELELPSDWLDEGVLKVVVLRVGLHDEVVADCDELVLEGREVPLLPVCAETVDDDVDRVEEVVVIMRVDVCAAAAAAAAELER